MVKADGNTLFWIRYAVWGFVFSMCLGLVAALSPALAAQEDGEAVYRHLSQLANSGDNGQIEKLNTLPRDVDWSDAASRQFKGHLRFLQSSKKGTDDQTRLFFARSTDGQILILTIPDRTSPDYQNLESLIKSKLNFNLKVVDLAVGDRTFTFAKWITPPEQPLFDKIFKIMIILMLFLVMVGMGLTLTGQDFAVLIAKPKGILVGEILQFAVMPLVAAALGYLMGFHESYPYIYVGMILITVTPGGVTSNLMTHYAKGDVALSVSMTSLSTILSIFFVPLLLNTYCANIPDVKVPTGTIALTIIVLVLVPLGLGMLFRKFKEDTAKKLIPVFSLLGIIALLFLIIAGIMSNLEGFADTERHGVRFYTMVLLLTSSGMIIGAFVSKLAGISNFQIRAISLETGLRNASLAMTLALLIQDAMGDFHSSMFWVSGMFGLSMYVAGLVAIKIYPGILPVEDSNQGK